MVLARLCHLLYCERSCCCGCGTTHGSVRSSIAWKTPASSRKEKISKAGRLSRSLTLLFSIMLAIQLRNPSSFGVARRFA